jgi:hypothetical protein
MFGMEPWHKWSNSLEDSSRFSLVECRVVSRFVSMHHQNLLNLAKYNTLISPKAHSLQQWFLNKLKFSWKVNLKSFVKTIQLFQWMVANQYTLWSCWHVQSLDFAVWDEIYFDSFENISYFKADVIYPSLMQLWYRDIPNSGPVWSVPFNGKWLRCLSS